ncbi:MAG: PorV/PorQ family protein [Calditrichaeota bacterium]|nr:PorV/PorQ family protein [Calditrichota bacterium]
MKKFTVLLVILLLTVSAFAQQEVNKVGTTAANFLKLEVGARAVALAGAFTALANDATALHWNPAGIAFSNQMKAIYSNTNLYAGIRHQFLGIIFPFSANYFGVSFNYVDIGKIERTTEFDPEGTGLFFQNFSMAVGLSYARVLTDRITFGVTARWVHEQIWQEKADGVSGDIGLIFTPGLTGLRLGMSITNFGPSMAMNSGPLQTFYYAPLPDQPGTGNRNLEAQLQVMDYALPISFQMGVAFDIAGAESVILPNPSNRVSFILEINDSFDNPMRAKWAMEYEWRKILALRMGYKQNYDLGEFTWGGGLKIPFRNMDLRFDYAMAQYGDLGNVHVTTLQIGF